MNRFGFVNSGRNFKLPSPDWHKCQCKSLRLLRRLNFVLIIIIFVLLIERVPEMSLDVVCRLLAKKKHRKRHHVSAKFCFLNLTMFYFVVWVLYFCGLNVYALEMRPCVFFVNVSYLKLCASNDVNFFYYSLSMMGKFDDLYHLQFENDDLFEKM